MTESLRVKHDRLCEVLDGMESVLVAYSGGVDNLFNRKPEKIGAGQITNIAPTSGGGTTIADGVASNPLPGYYDVLGRRYFLQVKLAF